MRAGDAEAAEVDGTETAVLPFETASPPLQVHAGGQARPAEFRLAIGRALGTVVVTLHGDIVPAVVPTLRAVLADLIDGQGNLSVALDLRDVQRVDPVAMAVFAGAADSCRRRGGSLSLCWETDDALRRLERGECPKHGDARTLSMASHPSKLRDSQGDWDDRGRRRASGDRLGVVRPRVSNGG